MRYSFLFLIFLIATYTSADELLLPDNITPEKEETSQVETFISTEKTSRVDPPKLSASEVAKLVEMRYSGKIFSVTLLEDKPTYVIKMLNNGHMKVLYVDANHGYFTELSD